MIIFKQKALKFEGNWLLTGPNEIPMPGYDTCPMPVVPLHSDDEPIPINFCPQRKYGSNNGTARETLGTVESHTYTSSSIASTRQRNTGSFHNVSQEGYHHIVEEQEEEEESEEEQMI